MTRSVLLALVVASCTVAAPAVAQPGVLPPGLEGEVAALVFPGDDPPELFGGIAVSGARVERTHIEVPLAGEDASGLVHLLAKGATADGALVGETPSFAVWLVQGLDTPGMRQAAAALRDRVAARDRGDFFDAHAVVPVAAERSRGPRRTSAWTTPARWLRGVLWVFLLGGVAWLAWRRRRERGRARDDLRAAIVLFAGALALRLLLPPWAPLHANEHGIEEMRGLLGDSTAFEAALYGSAYLDVTRVVLAPFGRWADGPFVFAALAGALSPALLFALGRVLAPDARFGALVAGLALAIHPTHVRLSLSESARPLSGALFLLGAVLAAFAFTSTRRSSTRALAWLCAAAAWALAAELRVITVLLPWAGLWLVLVARGRWRERPSTGAIAMGLAIIGGVTALHAPTLERAIGAAGQRPMDWSMLYDRALGPHDVLLDPTLTPWLLLPLAAAAGLRLWMTGERRLVIAATGAFLLLLPPSLLVLASRTDAIRYQSEAHFALMLLLVGVPGPALAAPGRRLWAFAPLALMVSAAPGWMDVMRPDVHAQAYAVVRDHAPPPPTPIVVLPIEMAEERRVRASFPDYLIERSGRVTTAPEGDCRVWVGVPCWSFSREEVQAGLAHLEVAEGAPLRPECAAILGGPERAASAVASLPALDVPHRREEFHDIVASRPRVGFAPCPPPDR